MKIPKKDSEPIFDLINYLGHSFALKLLSSTSIDDRKSKYMDALIIALKEPFFNEQVKSKNFYFQMVSFYVFLPIHVFLFIIMYRTLKLKPFI